MKHAILITCYKDIDFVSQIIEYFDDDFDFFIHIDKKCKEEYALKNAPHIHVYKKYNVFWGGLNHCKAILLLMEEAVNKGNYDYFHLITGSDFPIKPLPEFKRFFEQHNGQNFLEYFKLPREGWWYDGGPGRLAHYWFGIDCFDMRRYLSLHGILLKIQRKIFKINRKFNFFDGNLWGAGTYWSLTGLAIRSMLDYFANNPTYLKRFKFVPIAEEILLPTILLNLPDIPLTANSLRYIDWTPPAGGSPNTLTIDDYDKLMQSDCMFARKFDREKSKELLDKLTKKQCNSQ